MNSVRCKLRRPLPLNTAELLPCPYCGGRGSFGGIFEGAAVIASRVKCGSCGALVRGLTAREAFAKWNLRAGIEPIPPDPPDPIEDGDIRFVPGHYMACDVGSGGGGIDGWCDQIRSLIPYPEWRGASTLLNWAHIEPGARGVYDFSKVDRLLAAAKESGKLWMFGIKFQWFSGSPTSPDGKIPPYLDDIEDGSPGYSLRPEGEEWNGDLSLYVHMHDPRVMNPYIEMLEAVADHIGDDPTLAMVSFGETAVDAPEESGFSTEKYYEQMAQRYAPAMREAFPHTELRIGTNYLGNRGVMCEFLDDIDAYDFAPGGPDNYSRPYDSNLAMNGLVDGYDRRGTRAWMSENQRPAGSSGGRDTSTQEIIDFNVSGPIEEGGSIDPHYWLWNRNGDGSGGAETWPTIRDTVCAMGGATNTTNPRTHVRRWNNPRSWVRCVSASGMRIV